MAGRKKKKRAERQAAQAPVEGAQPPRDAVARRAGGGHRNSRPGLVRPALLAQASIAGVILGLLMLVLNLVSVATSGEPVISASASGSGPSSSPGGFPLTPDATAAPGATPGSTPAPSGTATAGSAGPTAVAQGIDPQVLARRSKGDPGAQVVITEWFDFL